MRSVLLALALALVAQPAPVLVPDEARTTWAPGVAGDIPARLTVCATVPLGGSIQAALDACPDGQTVRLVAGRYLAPEPVRIYRSITLRGAGRGVTVLRKENGAVDGVLSSEDVNPIVIMGASRWPHYDESTAVALTADAVAGTRSVTVANAAGLETGQVVVVDEDDYNHGAWTMIQGLRTWATDRIVYKRHDPPIQWVDDPFPASLSWFSRAGRSVNELKEIASVVGSVVTFTSPLHATYRASWQAQLTRHDTPFVRMAGIEDLTLSGGSDGNLKVGATVDSWARGIESTMWGGAGVDIYHSLRFELRDSLVHHTVWPYPGGAGYGLSLSWGATDILVENNTIWDANKVMVVRSSGAGTVVGYNAMDDGFIAYNRLWQEVGLNASHMQGSHHVLFEGNDSWNYDTDNTHGTTFGVVIFRNWLRGRRSSHEDGSNVRAAGVMTGSWWHAFIGNVLGEAGRMSGWQFEDVGVGGWGPAPAIWRIGYDPGLWDQQADPKTRATLTREGNFDYLSNAVGWSAGPRSLPDSLYLTSRPAFMAGRVWPWVDPLGAVKIHGSLPAREALVANDSLQPRPPTGARVVPGDR